MKKSKSFLENLGEQIKKLGDISSDQEYPNLCKKYGEIVTILNKVQHDKETKISGCLKEIYTIVCKKNNVLREEKRSKKNVSDALTNQIRAHEDFLSFLVKPDSFNESQENLYLILAKRIVDEEIMQKLNVIFKKVYSDLGSPDNGLTKEKIKKFDFMFKLKTFLVVFQDDKKDKSFAKLKTKVIEASQEFESLKKEDSRLSKSKNFADKLNCLLKEIYFIALENKAKNPDPYAYIINLFLAYSQQEKNSNKVSDAQFITEVCNKTVTENILIESGIIKTTSVPSNYSDTAFFKFSRVSAFIDLKSKEINEAEHNSESVFAP
ncbi:MAG: hypothetical protein REH83_02955 [Rickettsiella sp.]|nr:hypothetical protein [Rickettsiella sp.]